MSTRLTTQGASSPAVSSWLGVCAIALGAYALVVTEFLAVGLLPGIVKGLGVSEGIAGLTVTATAVLGFIAAPTVQNQYNLVDRKSEDVLDFCDKHGIGFIPWFPLAAGELAKPGSIVNTIAKEHGVTTGAIALAWLLKRSRVVLPIPGTGSVDHLIKNGAGAGVELTDEQFRELDRQGREAANKN